MSGKPRLHDYIEHVLAAIERIRRYTTGMDEAAFLGDERTQDAVIRNFAIIGEASRNIVRDHPDFAAAHPELPLIIAYDMRNALMHGYYEIDLSIVWRTIQDDLPRLRDQLRAIRDV